MTNSLALVRHMPTAWNSPDGCRGAQVPASGPGNTGLAGPAELAGFRWCRARYAAPSIRSTPRHRRFAIEPRLTEMDWAAWGGQTLAELRAGLGRAMAESEAAGDRFRPAGGKAARCCRRG